MKAQKCTCAKAQLDLTPSHYALRADCIRRIDIVLREVVSNPDDIDAVWALGRALATAEADRQEHERREKQLALEAKEAETAAAKAMEEAAKAMEKERKKEEAARAKEDAVRRKSLEKEAKEVAEAAARAAKEERLANEERVRVQKREMQQAEAASREEARQRQAAEVAMAREAERVAKAEQAQAQAAAKAEQQKVKEWQQQAQQQQREADKKAKAEAVERKKEADARAKADALADAAERKAAAEKAKAEAERIKEEAKEIARRQREAEAKAKEEEEARRKAAAEAAAAAKANGDEPPEQPQEELPAPQAPSAAAAPSGSGISSASTMAQQRLERAHSRLASAFLPRRNSLGEGDENAEVPSPERRFSLGAGMSGMKSDEFKLLGLGTKKKDVAAKALEKDNSKKDTKGSEAAAAPSTAILPHTEPSAKWASMWRKGGRKGTEIEVATDCIALHPNCNELICSGADGDKNSVCVYSLASSAIVLSLTGHTDRVCSVATQAAGFRHGPSTTEGGGSDDEEDYLIASGSRDKTIRLWSRKTGSCLRVLEGSSESVFSLGIRRGWLLGGEGSSRQGAIAKARLWAIERSDDGQSIGKAKLQTTFQEHGGPIWSVALAHDLAVTASDDGTARVWYLQNASARSLATLKHPMWVCSVSIAEDDAYCATGCGDGKIRLWSLRAGLTTTQYQCLRTFDHCDSQSGTYPLRVRWLHFGALVSSGMDDNVKLWSLNTDGEATNVATLPHGDNVRGLTVSASGIVASAGGSKSKSVIVWRAK